MLLACGMCKAVFMGNVEGPHATTVWEFQLVKLVFSGTAKQRSTEDLVPSDPGYKRQSKSHSKNFIQML